MSGISINLRYLPSPHDGWEAYITLDDERWGGNAITWDDPLKAVTMLAQNLAEALRRETR